MKKILPILFLSTQFYTQAFGIINGKPMEELTPPVALTSIFAYSIRVEGLPDDPCTATWLSTDSFITASHCFLLNDFSTTMPKICLNIQAKNAPSFSSESNCLDYSEYEVSLAPQVTKGSRAPTRKLKKVVTIQIPDIVIVKIKNASFLETNKHEVLKIADKTKENFELNSLVAIGQGCPQFPPTRFAFPEGQGTMRWQFIPSITPDKEGNIISNWRDGDSFGASCWGDSGGPLILKGDGGGIRGIISGMKRTLDYDQGKTTESITYFADLFHPTTYAWLIPFSAEK